MRGFGKANMSLLKLSSIEEIRECKRIVCYPAASGAYYFSQFLEREYPEIRSRIVALGDKDPKKHGLEFLGLPIVSPDNLQDLRPDAICIATILHYNEIAGELRGLLPANCRIIDVNSIGEYLASAAKSSVLAQNLNISQTDAELSRLLDPVSPSYLCLPFGQNRFSIGEKGALTFHLLDSIALPSDLTGKSVFDIGASDGFYSYECEARGASTVVAADKPAWSDATVAKRLSLTKELYRSNVRHELFAVEDLATKLEGTFDIVLALGLYYHVKDPYLMFRTLYTKTRERLIISGRTLVTSVANPMDGGASDAPYMVLSHPKLGKWLANISCLKEMLLSAGFARVEVTFDLVPPGSLIGSTALCAYVK